jgi:hypothetical protein
MYGLSQARSSPEEWANRGDNLMENRLEKLASMAYLQVHTTYAISPPRPVGEEKLHFFNFHCSLT